MCLSSCQIRCTNLRSCRSLLPSHLYKVIHLQTPNPKSSTCNSTSSVGRSLATECQCLSGYTGPGGGPCEPCATGTFKSTIGSAECSLCDEGTYGEQTASTSDTACVACPPFSTAPAGSSTAEACLCLEGYEANEEGESVCVACAPGKYSSVAIRLTNLQELGPAPYTLHPTPEAPTEKTSSHQTQTRAPNQDTSRICSHLSSGEGDTSIARPDTDMCGKEEAKMLPEGAEVKQQPRLPGLRRSHSEIELEVLKGHVVGAVVRA